MVREPLVVAETFVLVPKSIVSDSQSQRFIATHDGAFHCDDACAIALLLQLNEWRFVDVVRTRASDVLVRADVVVDVGGEYDPNRRRFDHHQKGFDEKFGPKFTATKLSSAGMVWLHYGGRILRERYGVTDDVLVGKLVDKMYENLFESIDAIDNGVNVVPGGGEPLYLVRTDLSSRVARLNLEWTDSRVDSLCAQEFTEAVRMASTEICAHLHGLVDIWLPARTLVSNAFAQRMSVHASGQVLELEQPCPWEQHLFDIEEEETEQRMADAENGCTGVEESGAKRLRNEETSSPLPILFVIHKGFGDDWRVRAVRASRKQFGNRKDLAAQFRGLRDAEIAKLPGGEGINFVHNAGFLGGCQSREAALRLVEMSLK